MPIGDTPVLCSVPGAPGAVTTVAVRAPRRSRRGIACTGRTSAPGRLRRSQPTHPLAPAPGRRSEDPPACETFLRNAARESTVPGPRFLRAMRRWGPRTKVWQRCMGAIHKFSTCSPHTPRRRAIRLGHMLVGRPRRDSTTLSNATTRAHQPYARNTTACGGLCKAVLLRD
jgi:hypothetical protein